MRFLAFMGSALEDKTKLQVLGLLSGSKWCLLERRLDSELVDRADVYGALRNGRQAVQGLQERRRCFAGKLAQKETGHCSVVVMVSLASS